MNFRRKTSERGKNLKMWPLRFLGSCVYTQVPNQLILKWGDYLGNPDLIRGVKRLFLFLYDNTHTHVEGCALYPVPVPKPQYWTRQFHSSVCLTQLGPLKGPEAVERHGPQGGTGSDSGGHKFLFLDSKTGFLAGLSVSPQEPWVFSFLCWFSSLSFSFYTGISGVFCWQINFQEPYTWPLWL